MDLEAEMARFEAELAAVEQQASSSAVPDAREPPRPSQPPAQLRQQTTYLPPPSMPPPGHAPPPRPAAQAQLPFSSSHPPFASIPQPHQHLAGPSGPLPPPPHLPPPPGVPPFQPLHSMAAPAPSQAPQTMYYAPPQMNPQALAGDQAAEAAEEEVWKKRKEQLIKSTEQEQQQKKKQLPKAVKRSAAGQTWWDPTLTEWPANDFRIFVGDLGNEVNDEILIKAFQKYASFAKAKVVRDKHSNKSKGFGFVSFLDGNDFAKAMKEMNGKYIGNRPCKLRKSEWTERNAPMKRGGGGGGRGQAAKKAKK